MCIRFQVMPDSSYFSFQHFLLTLISPPSNSILFLKVLKFLATKTSFMLDFSSISWQQCAQVKSHSLTVSDHRVHAVLLPWCFLRNAVQAAWAVPVCSSQAMTTNVLFDPPPLCHPIPTNTKAFAFFLHYYPTARALWSQLPHHFSNLVWALCVFSIFELPTGSVEL